MAKKVEETTLPAAKPSNVPATIENEQGKVLSIDEMFSQIESAELGQELASDYFKLEVGESERVIFVKMTEINAMNGKNGEMAEAVKLIASDRRYKVNADRMIVSTCKALSIEGRENVPLEISCIGEKKSKAGFKYKEFKINELNM